LKLCCNNSSIISTNIKGGYYYSSSPWSEYVQTAAADEELNSKQDGSTRSSSSVGLIAGVAVLSSLLALVSILLLVSVFCLRKTKAQHGKHAGKYFHSERFPFRKKPAADVPTVGTPTVELRNISTTEGETLTKSSVYEVVKGTSMLLEARAEASSEPQYEVLGETENPYASVEMETNPNRDLSLTANTAYQQIPSKQTKSKEGEQLCESLYSEYCVLFISIQIHGITYWAGGAYDN
jgi:hypothetical protein